MRVCQVRAVHMGSRLFLNATLYVDLVAIISILLTTTERMVGSLSWRTDIENTLEYLNDFTVWALKVFIDDYI